MVFDFQIQHCKLWVHNVDSTYIGVNWRAKLYQKLEESNQQVVVTNQGTIKGIIGVHDKMWIVEHSTHILCIYSLIDTGSNHLVELYKSIKSIKSRQSEWYKKTTAL